MDEFKLPIYYVNNELVDSHVIEDLELIKSDGIPMYEKLFSPKTTEAKFMARQWAKYYTTNQDFLKDSQMLLQTKFKSNKINTFMTYWNKIQENKEFKLKYQYVESSWLSSLNKSPAFLMFISIYFITSPALLLLSPIVLAIVPYLMLKMAGTDLTWGNYMVIFKTVIRQHAIGGLLLGFKDADTRQRGYLIATAAFFMIQLYTNAHAVYTFYTNMSHVHKVFDSLRIYLTDTITSMKAVEHAVFPLSTYASFRLAIGERKTILELFLGKMNGLRNISKCGTTRALFYELYDNKTLQETIQYTFGFHGFIQNIRKLNQRIGKQINECTFSDHTSFCKAYYPTTKPVKNTYTLDRNIIITGPNASGKTTMIKTTMINVLLSQQIGCGFYESATIFPYESFYCYINIPDTSGRDSLFQAEARRCKEIVDEVIKKKRTLCIFDELFSGTNPAEATAGACALLKYFTEFPTFRFLLTTHFIDVCENLSDSAIDMKHMKTLNDTYTYKLENGISYIKGGVKVLEQLQFPASIVMDCKKNFMRIK